MTPEYKFNRNLMKFRSIIVVLLTVGFTLGLGHSCGRPDESATRDLPSDTTDTWIKLFDGQTLNGWKEDEFNRPGTIQIKDRSLLFGEGYPFTALSWRGKFPTENYEVEVSAMRRSGGDIFCGLLFPVGTTYVSMVLGGWSNSVVGLSYVDYFDASSNETTLLMSFADNRWYRVRLRVTTEMIQAWVDDKQVINLMLRNHTLSPYTGLELLAPFGVFTWMTGAAMRDFRIRLLGQDRGVSQPG